MVKGWEAQRLDLRKASLVVWDDQKIFSNSSTKFEGMLSSNLESLWVFH